MSEMVVHWTLACHDEEGLHISGFSLGAALVLTWGAWYSVHDIHTCQMLVIINEGR